MFFKSSNFVFETLRMGGKLRTRGGAGGAGSVGGGGSKTEPVTVEEENKNRRPGSMSASSRTSWTKGRAA